MPHQDPHSIDPPDDNRPLLWIIIGLVSVVGIFIGIISLVPRGL